MRWDSASHPIPKLSLRGNATYDGHDDKTSPLTIAYVVTDTFPGGSAVTPRYSEDRVRLDGGADYALAHWLKIGVGGKVDNIHYGPGQVVTWTQNDEELGPRHGHADRTLEFHAEDRQRPAQGFCASTPPHCRPRRIR